LPGESRAFETFSYPGVIADYFIYLDFSTGSVRPLPPLRESRAQRRWRAVPARAGFVTSSRARASRRRPNDRNHRLAIGSPF